MEADLCGQGTCSVVLMLNRADKMSLFCKVTPACLHLSSCQRPSQSVTFCFLCQGGSSCAQLAKNKDVISLSLIQHFRNPFHSFSPTLFSSLHLNFAATVCAWERTSRGQVRAVTKLISYRDGVLTSR